MLTSDAACWSTQRLRIELSEPLLTNDDFLHIGPTRGRIHNPSRLALRVDRFTARRQEIVRRLIGVDTFDHFILPNMAAVRQTPLPVPVMLINDGGVAHEKDSAEVYVYMAA